MPELSVPDGVLHYEVTGTGPPLILIAGMMSDGASWQPVVGPLAETHQVICPDNRLTGRSRNHSGPVTLQSWAADILALCRHLNLTTVDLAGHSLGGLIAMEVAGLEPARVRSLLLLATAPVRIDRNIALFETLLRLRQPAYPKDVWLRVLFPWLFQADFFVASAAVETAISASLAYPFAQSPEDMAAQVAVLQGLNPIWSLSRVKCPTLVLLAEEDLLIPLATARAAFAGHASTKVDTIPAAGHSLHWDQPVAVACRMRQFLTEGKRA